MKKKGGIIGVLLLLLTSVTMLVVIVGCASSKKSGAIKIAGGEHVYAEWGEEFVAPQAQFYVDNQLDLSANISIQGSVDTNTLGDYALTYSALLGEDTITKTITVTVRDTKAPVISLVGGEEVAVRPGSSFTELGFTATDNKDGDITSSVKVEISTDKVTYTVADSSGNSVTIQRTIVYRDAEAPVITLIGENEILLEVNGKYKEQGATAVDDTDGDVTSKIVVSGSVDTKTPGAYNITYTVTDEAGNTASMVRVVRVHDTEAPVLTLTGEKKLYVMRGTEFADPGCTALDAIEGDLSSKITVSGKVDTSKLGVYTLTYTVKDAFDNTATVTRDVYVYIQQADVTGNAETGDKRVYLTFDDGPSQYTQTLLDILAKYNVKVTFFVTNQHSGKYQDLIKAEAEAGHTIAIHTYTHKYDKVYASVEAYFDDLEKMSDVIKKQTGQVPSIVRFPGGTSNTVSKSYCKGIMTKLSQMLPELGYKYIDWNIVSGDSEVSFLKPYTTYAAKRDAVAQNTIDHIKKRNGKYSVVLQHDITGWSVEATEQIILWGLENGYTFLPLTMNSPNCTSKPNN